jgi:hypothetical protein
MKIKVSTFENGEKKSFTGSKLVDKFNEIILEFENGNVYFPKDRIIIVEELSNINETKLFTNEIKENTFVNIIDVLTEPDGSVRLKLANKFNRRFDIILQDKFRFEDAYLMMQNRIIRDFDLYKFRLDFSKLVIRIEEF